MSANAVKSLANARSPCRGGNRLLWKNDTATNSTEHPGAEAGFWGGTGTTAGESSRRPRRAPAQRRASTSARLEPFHLGRYVDEQAFRFNERSRRHVLVPRARWKVIVDPHRAAPSSEARPSLILVVCCPRIPLGEYMSPAPSPATAPPVRLRVP